jgi:uncharacterized protein YndB with AHSA1/START domain
MSENAVAVAERLIRRPVAEVFEAFVDPAITSRFWFTKGSGRLGPGARVIWTWEMYGVSSPVKVTAFEPEARIEVAWGETGESTVVEWTFTALDEASTFVSIRNHGFRGTADEVLSQVVGSTEGFAIVLAGAKALLEHGIELGLVRDRFPQGLGAG